MRNLAGYICNKLLWTAQSHGAVILDAQAHPLSANSEMENFQFACWRPALVLQLSAEIAKRINRGIYNLAMRPLTKSDAMTAEQASDKVEDLQHHF